MEIGGLQKLTLVDYPGRLSCTVFLLGCNFRCPFCYSPELVLPEEMKNQPRISQADFFDFLEERRRFLEGVVVCGGEPTIHSDLPQFLKKIKEMGYLVKLNTNGSNPQMLKKLIDRGLVDYISMDIKQSQKSMALAGKAGRKKGVQKYDEAAGVRVDLKKIRESIGLIKNSGLDYEFRTTLVPGIQSREDVLEIVKEIGAAKRYYIQRFRPGKTLDPGLKKLRPYSEKYLLAIQKAVSPFFEVCRLR